LLVPILMVEALLEKPLGSVLLPSLYWQAKVLLEKPLGSGLLHWQTHWHPFDWRNVMVQEVGKVVVLPLRKRMGAEKPVVMALKKTMEAEKVVALALMKTKGKVQEKPLTR